MDNEVSAINVYQIEIRYLWVAPCLWSIKRQGEKEGAVRTKGLSIQIK